nr:hypothetical protein [Pseudosulfitobacter pseudonitzschiae]
MRKQRKVLKHQSDFAVIGGAWDMSSPRIRMRPWVGVFEPCDHAQQGGLATARRPQKGDEFALHDVDRHAVDRHGSVKPFGDVINGQDRFGRGVVTGQIRGLHDGCDGDMRWLDHAPKFAPPTPFKSNSKFFLNHSIMDVCRDCPRCGWDETVRVVLRALNLPVFFGIPS